MAFINGPGSVSHLRTVKSHPTRCKLRRPLLMTASTENGRSVVVLSSINADSTYALDTLPLRGETVLSKSLKRTLGGKGANTAVAASKAGVTTYFVGAVGSDDTFLTTLNEYGVNVSHCMRDDSVETGHAIILLETTGENSIVVHAGANALVTAHALDSLHDILHHAVVALHLEIPHDVVQDVAVRASEAGAIVVLNPSPVPREGSPLLDPNAPLWRSVDVLIVNAIELSLISGRNAPSFDDIPSGESLPEKHIRSLEHMLCDLRNKMCIRDTTAVVITLGSHGVIFQNPNNQHESSENGALKQVPALTNIDVVDSTGAGDCLTGYISACLASGLDLASTVRHAVVAAGLCVTKFGTAHAVPEMSVVKGRLFGMGGNG